MCSVLRIYKRVYFYVVELLRKSDLLDTWEWLVIRVSIVLNGFFKLLKDVLKYSKNLIKGSPINKKLCLGALFLEGYKVKDHTNEKNSELAIEGVSHNYLYWEKMEKYKSLQWEREVVRCALWSEVVGLGKLAMGWLWSRIAYLIFSIVSELKVRAQTRNLAVQTLTILGQLIQKMWFGFLDWWIEKLWVRVLWLYIAWLLSTCIFSLSVSILVILLLLISLPIQKTNQQTN